MPINWDALEAPKPRVLTPKKGTRVDVEKDIPKRLRDDVEEVLAENLKRPEGATPKYVTQELGDNESAKEFAKLLRKYSTYRPKEIGGQITIRVANTKDINAGTATHVDYAPKELEVKEPKTGEKAPEPKQEPKTGEKAPEPKPGDKAGLTGKPAPKAPSGVSRSGESLKPAPKVPGRK